jgi:hypothetical protein
VAILAVPLCHNLAECAELSRTEHLLDTKMGCAGSTARDKSPASASVVPRAAPPVQPPPRVGAQAARPPRGVTTRIEPLLREVPQEELAQADKGCTGEDDDELVEECLSRGAEISISTPAMLTPEGLD